MKKPIYNEFERWVILKTDSFSRARLLLNLSILKLERELSKIINNNKK